MLGEKDALIDELREKNEAFCEMYDHVRQKNDALAKQAADAQIVKSPTIEFLVQILNQLMI